MNPSLNLLTPYRKRIDATGRDAGLLQFMRQRKVISACLILSVGLHISFLVRFSGTEQLSDDRQPTTHSIDVVLTHSTPEQVPQTVQEKPLRHQKKPQPVERREPAKKIPQEILTSKQPAPTPMPEAPTNIPQPEPVPQEQPVEQAAMPEQQAVAEQALLVSEKQQYLQRIVAHLDKHKFYPRAARRRHIEGNVKVSFDLLRDGNILNLQILAAHSALEKATEQSIYQSLPLPPRPENLLALNEIKIEYSMEFSLQD